MKFGYTVVLIMGFGELAVALGVLARLIWIAFNATACCAAPELHLRACDLEKTCHLITIISA